MPSSAQHANTPGGPLVATTAIPYPSSTATGIIDFTQFWQGSMFLSPGALGSRVWNAGAGISPDVSPGYTGAWMILYNDSDSFLNITFNNSQTPDFCPPHHMRPIPIPWDEHACTWSIQYQNLIAAPTCQQQLSTFFVDQVAIASGYRLVEGPFNPPMPSAAGIGPGTLPPGVIVPGTSITSPIQVEEVDILDHLSHLSWWSLTSSGVGTFTLGRIGGTGSLSLAPAGAMTLQSGVTTVYSTDSSGDLTTIAGLATTGYGTLVQVTQSGLIHVTALTATTILNYAPVTGASYLLWLGLDVANGGASTCTLSIAYTDVRGVARTVFAVPYNTLAAVNGVALATNDYPIIPMPLMAINNASNVVVTYTDSTGTPNDRISAILYRVS